ncbi:MAG: bacteriophage holin [Candidatus Omnitrophica bacterium]|nr:bacteriophage holin [Candidatus Omnitrophota bacterium]MCF7894305.1 bacteriophage holin [Candidatus Omnitrophota bacterium]
MKLKILAFGLALGILWGLGALVLGILAIFGYGLTWVAVLSSVYIGYGATILGSLVGALWAFVDAFVGGVLFAWLYNKLSRS